MPVLIKSVMIDNKIRFRVIEGQGPYNTSLNVQGSKSIRLNNPVGSTFICDSLEYAGTFYRATGNIKLDDGSSIKPKKKRRSLNLKSPINISEFL